MDNESRARNSILCLLSLCFLFWHCGKMPTQLIAPEDSLSHAMPASPDSLPSKGGSQTDTVGTPRKDSFPHTLLTSRQRIHFKTFSARLAIDYTSPKENLTLTGYLRLRKDSIIWLSLYSFGFIEVARIEVMPEKIIFLDKINNTVLIKKPDFIARLLRMPLDYPSLERFLMGQVWVDSLASEAIPYEKNWVITQRTPYYTVSNYYEGTNYGLFKSYFQFSPLRRTEVFFEDYAPMPPPFDAPFSRQRTLAIQDKDTTYLEVQFKEIKWDQALTYPMKIPAKFKVESDF